MNVLDQFAIARCHGSFPRRLSPYWFSMVSLRSICGTLFKVCFTRNILCSSEHPWILVTFYRPFFTRRKMLRVVCVFCYVWCVFCYVWCVCFVTCGVCFATCGVCVLLRVVCVFCSFSQSLSAFLVFY